MASWGKRRTPRPPRSPIYADPQHHANKKHWQKARLPCARCKGWIDYDGPATLTTRTGRKVQNPRRLVVGHIIAVDIARRHGWTMQQINALTNTQPECQNCSNRSGGQARVRKVQSAALVRKAVANTSRAW